MLTSIIPALCCASVEVMNPVKSSPAAALEALKRGNQRFVQGRMKFPHLDIERRRLAAEESQAQHAFATILSCSDSRVPVEALFDVGIMDVFVVRMAGFGCTSNGIGCIEYGVLYVQTPLVVILGHTQCGAVTAATQSYQGRGHPYERNIAPLLSYVRPAVARAAAAHPGIEGDDLIPYAIEENIRQGVTKFVRASPASQALIDEGKLRVVGALYDIGTGQVHWRL